MIDLDACAEGVFNNDRTWIGRAITLVESTHPEDQGLAAELLKRLGPFLGFTWRVGVTGPPGVGKSTFIDALGTFVTSLGHRVGVLTVDPSSSVSGGSILGDKTRMPNLAANDHAYIRPSPSAGSLGGVTRSTRSATVVLEAAGYDVILVETVGVGQSETAVADMVDFFLVLLLPGAGDELQGIKKGVLELADALVVNKADGSNKKAAQRAVRDYQAALAMTTPANPEWEPPVMAASALEYKGIGAVWDCIKAHTEAMDKSGERTRRRAAQQVQWMWEVVDDGLRLKMAAVPGAGDLVERLQQEVAIGDTAPPVAANQILAALADS